MQSIKEDKAGVTSGTTSLGALLKAKMESNR